MKLLLRDSRLLLFVTATLLVVGACNTDSDLLPGGEVESVPYRLLVEDVAADEPWSTHVAENPSDVPPELADVGLDWETDVDWGNEVVFVFTLAESSSCPFGPVENMEYSRPDMRLYPVVDLEGSPSACTDDATPHTVATAIRRDELPSGEFSVWVEADDPPAGVVDGVTRVAAGELTASEVSAPDVPPLDAEGSMEVGESRVAYSVTTHCGLERIFRPVDGRQWKLAERPAEQLDYIPDEWRAFVEGEEVDLLIERVADDRLTVVPVGSDDPLTYVPADDRLGCD